LIEKNTTPLKYSRPSWTN